MKHEEDIDFDKWEVLIDCASSNNFYIKLMQKGPYNDNFISDSKHFHDIIKFLSNLKYDLNIINGIEDIYDNINDLISDGYETMKDLNDKLNNADDDDGLNRNHYWISRTLTMMMTELYWCRFLYFFQCQRRRKT
jgi:hypothetical protein